MAIYKREPISHNLPNSWNDMDAVKYNDINGISGLRHTDNVIGAEQNSTYSCKNVYQDESSNLTVRPALRYLRNITAVDGVDVIADYGDFYHVKMYNEYYLSSDTWNIQIGEGRVAVQKANDRTYVMYTDTFGKLQFKEWQNGIKDVEPDLPTNLAESPQGRLYNLLSGETKYEIVPVIPRDIPDSLFSQPDISKVAKPDALAVSILSAGHIAFIYTDEIVIARQYGNTFKFINVPATISADAKILVEDMSSYFIVRTLRRINNSDGDEYALELSRYEVTYVGSLLQENQIIRYVSIPRSDDSTFVKVLDFDLSYGGTFVVALVTSVQTDSDHTIYTCEYVYYDGSEFGRVIRDAFSGAVTANDFEVKLAVAANGFIVVRFQRDALAEEAVEIIPYDITNYENESSGKDYLLDQRAYDTWDNLHVMADRNNWYLIDTTDGLKIYCDLTHHLADVPLSSKDDFIRPQPIEIPELTVEAVFNPIDTGLLVYSNNQYYHISPTTYRSYDFDFISNVQALTFNYDSTSIVASTDGGYNIFTRDILPQYVHANRSVSDSFPVLSEIEDTVLTSFYLDNIYWFVTKHRIFGTGVVNEQFSIKFFDPMKYFHFDEELTGAIRVSDTAFWVLHANGAYLIYKGTSQIYDELSGGYTEMLTWLCTSAAKSKGCDFDNAVLTLPVSNYVACVTSDDISIIQMRENVQTDDRMLVPITTGIQKFIAKLLNSTKDIVTGIFKYNALFFMNPEKENGYVPVMVYNTTTESWWYWELPVDRVSQVTNTETNVNIVARVDTATNVYDLCTDYFDFKLGGLTWELYADRLLADTPTKIEWFWESALLHFGTVDYKKQLLFTNFTFGERETSTVSFEYNFEVYDREYSDRSWTDITHVVERASTYSCKNIIAKYMYLQLYLRNSTSDDYDSYTRPKFSTLSFKYRILPGGLL